MRQARHQLIEQGGVQQQQQQQRGGRGQAAARATASAGQVQQMGGGRCNVFFTGRGFFCTAIDEV